MAESMSLAEWDAWAAEQERRGWRDEDGYRVYDQRPAWAKPQPRLGRFLGYENDVPVFADPNEPNEPKSSDTTRDETLDWDAPEILTSVKIVEWKAEAERLLCKTMEGPYSVIVALCDHILASPAPPSGERPLKATAEENWAISEAARIALANTYGIVVPGDAMNFAFNRALAHRPPAEKEER